MEYSTIPKMFRSVCEEFSDSKTAIKYKKHVDQEYRLMDYEELRDKVECFALGLLELGVHTGDRIGIVSENRIDWVIADLSIVCLGAVDVPIFSTHTAKQEEYIFNDSSVVAIIVSNDFQLGKVLEFKDNLSSLRHVIVMNDEFKSDDVSVKNMKDIIGRGRELKPKEERRKQINEFIDKVNPEDLLTIIYTSGTTGNPKGVMLTNTNIVSNIEGFKDVIYFGPEDTFLSFLPLCHSYERATGYYGGLLSGSTMALAESVETVATNILEIKPTLITTVPKLLETIRKKIYNNISREKAVKKVIFNWAVETGLKYQTALDEGRNPTGLKAKYKIADKLVFSKIKEKTGGNLRYFISGGAALPYEVAVFFRTIGINVIEGYGLTETSPVIAANRPEDNELGTVGKALFNVDVKIADDGEILARGPNVMIGYWNDPYATQKAIDDDGWLYTGDVGIITERGNIKITDRKKNIFVSSGGKNIAPQPIESLLQQSQYIEHVVLIGDNREYCTALITPDYEQLQSLSEEFEVEYNEPSELISNPKIITHIKKIIDYLQRDLAKFERVRRFRLLSQPFTIENGELSPKLSIKRHVVERKYSDFIEQMYKS